MLLKINESSKHGLQQLLFVVQVIYWWHKNVRNTTQIIVLAFLVRILHRLICMQNLYVLRRLGNLSHGDSSTIFAMCPDSFYFILHNFMFTLISLMVNCKFRFASYVFNLAFYQPIYVLLIHWCIHNQLHHGKEILLIMHYVYVSLQTTEEKRN